MNTDALKELVPGWDEIAAAIKNNGDKRLRRYVRQESVSLNEPRPIPEGIRRMVEMVASDLQCIKDRCNGTVAVLDTATYPVITASIPASVNPESAPTLCLYNMGDTRPIGDPNEWVADPLGAKTVEIDGQRVIIGRGVHNSKSGLAGMIDTIEILADYSRLPVNLEVIIDFEEEVRPNSVQEVVSRDPERYRKCAAVLMPLMTEGFGCLWLAYKGVAVCTMKLRSRRPQVHSGMESILRGPYLPQELCDIINEVWDDSYHGLMEFDRTLHHLVSDSEVELARRLAATMDRDDMAARCGVPAALLRSKLTEQCILDLGRSHANVLGFGIGPSQGSVPMTGWINLEFRISPSVTLSPRELEDIIRGYLENVASDVLVSGEVVLDSIIFEAGTGQGFRGAEADSAFVRAILDSYEACGVKMDLSPCCFGSVPEGATFTNLGLPFLVAGLGRGGNFHAPNEYIVEADYPRFIQWLIAFLFRFAQER